MEHFKMMVRENKKAFLALLALLLVFVGLSATRCVDLQHQREAEIQQEQEKQADQGMSGGEPSADDLENEAASKLNEAQRQTQAAYDDETSAFVALLSSNVWTAKGETNTLQFTEKTYTETTQSGSETHPYVIAAMMTGNDGTEQVETTNAAIETDTGTYILEFYKAIGDGAADGVMGLSCPAFKNEGYTRGTSASGLTIAGLNSGFADIIDGQSTELENAVKDYCSQHYPTASTATWEKIAQVDWEAGTVITEFTLNNSSKTQVTVTYHTEAKTFEVK